MDKKNELIDLDELDKVVGGANGYVYYIDDDRDGSRGYHMIISKNPLTKEQVEDYMYDPPHPDTGPVAYGFIEKEKAEAFHKDGKSKGYEFIYYGTMK